MAVTAFKSVSNRAASNLGASIGSGDATLTVLPGEGARFPASNFWVTIDDERLLCTSRSTDTLTVTRAQQGSAAAGHAAGAPVRMNITAGHFDDVHAAVNSLEGKLPITNADVAAGAGIELSKLATDPLARGNHTGTQLASTVSDLSSAVVALLTDANIPDTISLANITQITNRAHASLQSLGADDHSIYALLAGRSGGQTLIGGTAAADNLTLKPTAGASPTGDVILDLSAATTQSLNVLLATSSTASQRVIQIGTGQSIAMGAGSQMRGFQVEGTYTFAGNPNASAFQVFQMAASIVLDSNAATNLNNIGIFRGLPVITMDPGVVAYGNLGMTGSTTVEDTLTLVAATGGATATVTAWSSVFHQGVVDTGWTVTTKRGLWFKAPTGAGTIGTLVAVDVDDLETFDTGAGTLTNPALSLRSLGANVQMRHAGPVIVGQNAAPNTTKGLDLDGDLATRAANLALANGANNDIAIGNRSFIRITGPTAAFNITSLATPYDGKIVTLVNTTAFAMTITNAAATGTAANRIVNTTNADLVGTAGNQTSVTLIYDATTARWRDFAFRP